MSTITFAPAVKHLAKLRCALVGPAGSGKTFTALTIAAGLGAKVAALDTEHGSMEKYADLFQFDVMKLDSFAPQVCMDGIAAAAKAGYDVLVIDSLSHFWMGKDGELEMVDAVAKRNPSHNSFMAWKEVTPIHNRLIDCILSAPLHIIATMRTKTEWVMEKNDKGKTEPRKVGLAPVMRDSIEFEFDILGELDQQNTLIISKSRCRELSGVVIPKPSGQLAETLKAWLAGAPVPEQPRREAPPPSVPVITEGQRKRLFALAGKAKVADGTLKAWLLKVYGYTSTSQIAQSHYDAICGAIERGSVTVPVDGPADGLITMREIEALMAAVAKEGISVGAFEEFLRVTYRCQALNLPLTEYGHVLDQVQGGYVAQWCQDNQTAEGEQATA